MFIAVTEQLYLGDAVLLLFFPTLLYLKPVDVVISDGVTYQLHAVQVWNRIRVSVSVQNSTPGETGNRIKAVDKLKYLYFTFFPGKFQLLKTSLSFEQEIMERIVLWWIFFSHEVHFSEGLKLKK